MMMMALKFKCQRWPADDLTAGYHAVCIRPLLHKEVKKKKRLSERKKKKKNCSLSGIPLFQPLHHSTFNKGFWISLKLSGLKHWRHIKYKSLALVLFLIIFTLQNLEIFERNNKKKNLVNVDFFLFL